MSEKNCKFFLQDIKNSLEKIFNYTKNINFDEFLADEKTRDAVERNLEIIGEAVKNISIEIRQTHPNIPFRQVAGMRDKLIHDYFGIDYEIIWKTITDKLPEFYSDIIKLIKELGE